MGFQSAIPAYSGCEALPIAIVISEFQRAVGDGEDVVCLLSEAHVLSAQIAGQEYRLGSPLDVAARIDEAHKRVFGVDDRRQLGRIGSRRPFVESCRGSMARQAVVRPIAVVLGSEEIESLLLSDNRR